jgi:hypothetical protein
MRALLGESARDYAQPFLGEVLPVLWESATSAGPNGWQLSGLTDNYLRVSAAAPRRLWNEITPVRLTGLEGIEFQGRIE